MILFLCKLWPYLAGGLIGWLLAGWFARRLKHTPPPVEKIVEKRVDKIVDNPEHLALISKLETENREISGLKSQIAGFNSSSSQVSKVETTLEKKVDNPAHIKRIAELEAQVAGLRKAPVIDLQAAKAAGIKIKSENDFTAIEGIGPQINDLIHADKITSFAELADTDVPHVQKILDDAGPRFKIANPGTWPDQANLAASNRWGALKALQDVLDGGVYPDTTALKKSASGNTSDNASNKKSASKTSAKSTPKPKAKPVEVKTVDVAAAKAAGFRVRPKNGQDDFTVVEGIGPKINDLIHDDGIHSYTELGKTSVESIQKILDNAGPRYRLAKPGTWPKQAELAAENKWEALKVWQDELDGGE